MRAVPWGPLRDQGDPVHPRRARREGASRSLANGCRSARQAQRTSGSRPGAEGGEGTRPSLRSGSGGNLAQQRPAEKQGSCALTRPGTRRPRPRLFPSPPTARGAAGGARAGRPLRGPGVALPRPPARAARSSPRPTARLGPGPHFAPRFRPDPPASGGFDWGQRPGRGREGRAERLGREEETRGDPRRGHGLAAPGTASSRRARGRRAGREGVGEGGGRCARGCGRRRR